MRRAETTAERAIDPGTVIATLGTMREKILSEIRRLAKANGNWPPGVRLFEQRTGIRPAVWRGVYWARWGDAVAEAGLQPNLPIAKIDEDFFLQKMAEMCRQLGKVPTAMEFRVFGRSRPDFPNHRSVYRRFHSTANMLRRLAEWVGSNGSYADVAVMLADRVPDSAEETKHLVDGFVYLIRWGADFKIAQGDQLEPRVKQVRTGLPGSGSLVHAIRTDDAPGIEAYWHRRFADRCAENGEWFKLTVSDVAAFKRRKFQ